jgi:hypothetical protein
MKYIAKFDCRRESGNGPYWGEGSMENDSLDDLKHDLMLASIYTGNWQDEHYEKMCNIKIYQIFETIQPQDINGYNERMAEIERLNTEKEFNQKQKSKENRLAQYEKLKAEFEKEEI